jgi:DNA sulfur modification protein DndC
MFQEIKASLQQLYLEDKRPWLVGFSGGKDSTMLASLIFDAVLSIPAEQRKKPISVLCTDTRVEIPAIAEMIEGTLDRMRKFSEQNNLNIDVNLLKPLIEESFWVNIIGRGYPPSNRTFRWCTQRMKIDPVNALVKQRGGHWGEAILHLGARRAESSTRAQTMAARQTRNGLRRHPDLPRVWVSNEFLPTGTFGPTCSRNPTPEAIAPSTSFTPAPATASAPSRLTPALPVAETAGSAAGRARWLTATRPARDCWPAATNAWRS